MKASKSMISSAFASVLALGVTGDSPAAEQNEGEKCYGIAKAEKNDCQTAASACAGSSKQDGNPSAFIYLPKGTCEKVVGGSLTAKS